MTALVETTTLLCAKIPVYRTFAEVLAKSGGSVAGYHANSEWMTCPEKSRLRAAGVRAKREATGFEKQSRELSALDFGTLVHELLAMRVCYGHDFTLNQLNVWSPELGDSYMKALAVLGVYEETFPEKSEPLQFLSVEEQIITSIGWSDNEPVPSWCPRTVRYDGLVYATTPTGEKQLYSLERKTASRSGPGSINVHTPQAMIQVALWNANKVLVEKYGRMYGVIVEPIVKTKIPSVDRTPVYISPRQEKMARDYMRYSDNGIVKFSAMPDGTYPKMLHSCWGRWSPCEYIGLCHEGVTGDYTINGEDIR
jgi:hypothetical protein